MDGGTGPRLLSSLGSMLRAAVNSVARTREVEACEVELRDAACRAAPHAGPAGLPARVAIETPGAQRARRVVQPGLEPHEGIGIGGPGAGPAQGGAGALGGACGGGQGIWEVAADAGIAGERKGVQP